MANVNVTTAFQGTIDSRIIQKFFREVELFSGVTNMPGAGGAHSYLVQAGSPDKFYLPKMNASDLQTVARQQLPETKGTVAQVEIPFESREQQLYVEFDPFTYKNTIPDFQPSGGNILDWAFNPKVQGAIFESIMRTHKDNLQLDLLQSDLSTFANGDTTAGAGDGTGRSAGGGSTEATGVITRLEQYATANTIPLAQQVTLPVGGLTTVNIIAAVEEILAAIPDRIYFKSNLKMFMSTKTWDMYKNALRNEYSGKGQTLSDAVSGTIDGRQAVPLSQWPDDNIMVTYSDGTAQSNIWTVTNAFSDMASTFKWDKIQNNSELMFFKMLYKFDNQILFPEDVVYATV